MLLWDCYHLKGKEDYQSDSCREGFYVNRQSTNSDNHHLWNWEDIVPCLWTVKSA